MPFIAGKTNHTKERIISQTIRLIRDHGYQNISLRKLLATLNLTTGSFYKHFSSKNDLFKDAAIVLSKKFSEDALIRLEKASSKDALNNLINLGEFVISQIETVPNLMNFLLFNPGVIQVYSHNLDDHLFGFLTLTHQILHDLIKQRGLTEPESALFIKMWAFIQGYGALIANGAVTYNRKLLLLSATQLIGGK